MMLLSMVRAQMKPISNAIGLLPVGTALRSSRLLGARLTMPSSKAGFHGGGFAAAWARRRFGYWACRIAGSLVIAVQTCLRHARSSRAHYFIVHLEQSMWVGERLMFRGTARRPGYGGLVLGGSVA